MLDINTIREQIYAGVLGKIIGVYLGRPIEGWSYKRIMEQFGDVYHYVNRQVGVPLIVADDDISGTFGFFRAMKDFGYPKKLSAAQIGETWRNYIIEDKTILWWGGLGRSTEHTAYHNLMNGIEAPLSGSIQQNGRDVAEQIGAQIFIEGFAMCYPGDPEKTVSLVREAASVSHDGMALDAACHLAAMDSLAFVEQDLDKILDNAYQYISDDRLKKLVYEVRDYCSRSDNWRETRAFLEDHYGYHLYPGTCHIAPNHAMVLASILHGKNDFQESVMIAASAGWDTDCNAGNVGAFNGIRLGLKAIDDGADLRSAVADRLLVITSDGGEAISDAVRESEYIVEAVCKLNNIEYQPFDTRFHFSYPGCLQGFSVCPDVSSPDFAVNVVPASQNEGIGIRCQGLGRGLVAAVSTPTFIEFPNYETNYLSTASPSLYESQEVSCTLRLIEGESVFAQLYVVCDGLKGHTHVMSSPERITNSLSEIKWKIPPLNGKPIMRLGLALTSPRSFSGEVRLVNMDYSPTPEHFLQEGVLMDSIWDIHPKQLQMWTSSAKHFCADMQHTFCVSHPRENGVATLGTNSWQNYAVNSRLTYGLCKEGGLVLNSKGHRQYYGASLSDGCATIFVMMHGHREVLAKTSFPFKTNCQYDVTFSYFDGTLRLQVNKEEILCAFDERFRSGACGYFVDCGTMLADRFLVFECKEDGYCK